MSILSKGDGKKKREIIAHSRPSINEQDATKTAEVIRSGMLTVGEMRAGFERAFEKRIDIPFGGAVSVDSGTAAIHLALLALGVRPKDRVILPAYLCAAPLYAIRYVGAEPLFADVNPKTAIAGESEFASALKLIKEKGDRQIIITVHPFGRSAPVDKIASLGLPVIEDCAQAVGGSLNGRPLGGFGDVSAFSFYATKVMTTGRGGMVCSKKIEIANEVRDLIKYDESEDGKVRFNYSMTEFQAALGKNQLERLETFVLRRKEIAGFYRDEFDRAKILMPLPAPPGEDIHYRFIIKAPNRVDEIIKKLEDDGIAARRPIFKPLYFYTGGSELPGTKRAYEENISIPIYPTLTDDEVERVAAVVINVMTKA
jgi:perosamine synthetase